MGGGQSPCENRTDTLVLRPLHFSRIPPRSHCDLPDASFFSSYGVCSPPHSRLLPPLQAGTGGRVFRMLSGISPRSLHAGGAGGVSGNASSSCSIIPQGSPPRIGSPLVCYKGFLQIPQTSYRYTPSSRFKTDLDSLGCSIRARNGVNPACSSLRRLMNFGDFGERARPSCFAFPKVLLMTAGGCGTGTKLVHLALPNGLPCVPIVNSRKSKE